MGKTSAPPPVPSQADMLGGILRQDMEFKVSKKVATGPRSDLDTVKVPQCLTPPQVGQSRRNPPLEATLMAALFT